MASSRKPYLGCKCSIYNAVISRRETATIENWEYKEDPRTLKFITSEGWVVEYKDIQIGTSSPVEILTVVRSYVEHENKKKEFTEQNTVTVQDCSKLDPLTLLDGKGNTVNIGDVAVVISDEKEPSPSSQCIVRWTGLDQGIWRALVEYVEGKGVWGEDIGVIDNQRLWHPDKEKFCDLLSMDRLERTSPERNLNVEITTKQLGCRHLGCKAKIPIPGDHLFGRVLWTGYIENDEYVLVETNSCANDDLHAPPSSVNPSDMYPAFELLNTTNSLYLVKSSVVIFESQCQIEVSASATAKIQQSPSPQSRVESAKSEGKSVRHEHRKDDTRVEKYSAPVITRQPSLQDRKYILCFSNYHYPLEGLGKRIKVQFSSGKCEAILCWFGKQGKSDWFVGVEIDPKTGAPEHGSNDGIFNGQQLWHRFHPHWLCFLVPIDYVDISTWTKLLHAGKNLICDAELSECPILLGQYVKFESNDIDVSCVLWTGLYKNAHHAVIKLALKSTRLPHWTDKIDPKKLVSFDSVPGFYGKMMFVPMSKLTKCETQRPIPTIEDKTSSHIGTEVSVQRNLGSFISGIVRWCGLIDGVFHCGIEMKVLVPNEYRGNELVVRNILSRVDGYKDSSLYNKFCIVPYTETVIHRSLTPPVDMRPVGFSINKNMKVEISDHVTFFGWVKWCGLFKGNWLVAMETEEPIAGEYNYYPGLAKQLNLLPNYTIFVSPLLVHPIYERDKILHKSPPGEPDKQSSPPKLKKVEKFNGVVYERKFFEDLILLKSLESGLDFKEDYLIEVELDASKGKRFGICRYIGKSQFDRKYYIGVELIQKTFEGSTNGTFPDENGVRLFKCEPKFGIIVPVEKIRPVNLTIPPPTGSTFATNKYQNGFIKVWCDVPHSKEFFKHLRVAETLPDEIKYQLNYLVEVNLNESYYKPSGACKWIGVDPTGTKYYVGVALDQSIDCEAATDGEFCGRRLFSCKPHCGVLLPSKRVKLHRDIVRDMVNTQAQIADLPDCLKILKCSNEDLQDNDYTLIPSEFCDREYVKCFNEDKGIQGKKNSCYMDTTILAMFALNNSFDSIFTMENCQRSMAMRILRQLIVNELRKNSFVPQANVMSFREKFEAEGNTEGMTSHQKDPEEFLLTLLEKIAKIPFFLQYKDGHTAYLLQLFFFLEYPKEVLSTEEMVELTFQSFEPGARLKCLPENLIMQIPREGRDLYGCRAIKHNVFLDMAPYIDEEARDPCSICLDASTRSCSDCCKSFCQKCVEKYCKEECYRCGSDKELICPYQLELYAVLCIEISHFVAFLRVREDVLSKQPVWLFYDSMHNRYGDYNIPLIQPMESDMEQWVKEFKSLSSIRGRSTYYNRLATNPYVLFYRDPRRCMYKFDN